MTTDSSFEPPLYTQEIFQTTNGSYKLQLNVCNFNGYIRVGIQKLTWCEVKNDYVNAAKGNCYFPAEVCDALVKLLPAAKAEAQALDAKVNGNARAGAYAGAKAPMRFAGVKHVGVQRGRAAGAADAVAAAACNGYSEDHPTPHPVRVYGKRRSDNDDNGGAGYKTTDEAKAPTNAVEQGHTREPADGEEIIESRKAARVEHARR
jgi:hypothetical protein